MHQKLCLFFWPFRSRSMQCDNCKREIQWFTVTSTLLHCAVFCKYVLVHGTINYCNSVYSFYMFLHCNSTVYICSAVNNNSTERFYGRLRICELYLLLLFCWYFKSRFVCIFCSLKHVLHYFGHVKLPFFPRIADLMNLYEFLQGCMSLYLALRYKKSELIVVVCKLGTILASFC